MEKISVLLLMINGADDQICQHRFLFIRAYLRLSLQVREFLEHVV